MSNEQRVSEAAERLRRMLINDGLLSVVYDHVQGGYLSSNYKAMAAAYEEDLKSVVRAYLAERDQKPLDKNFDDPMKAIDLAHEAAQALSESLGTIEQTAGEGGQAEQSTDVEQAMWLDGVAICLEPFFERAASLPTPPSEPKCPECEGIPTTAEAIAIEEARQAGENEGWRLFEAFLDRCEGFLDTEGMASTEKEVAEVIERFVSEARDDLDRRRGRHLPSPEELLAKINLKELAAQTHGCHACGEERPPRIVAGKLTCPECGSENIVCID